MQGTTNLLTLRQELAARMHDYLAGTTTNPSDRSYFRDSEGLTEGDNWWAQGWIQITGGIGATINLNAIKRVREYAQASQMGRIWGTFPSSLAASTNYALYRLTEPAMYARALNNGARMSYPYLYRYIKDETIVVQANTWSYAVPSLMRDIAEVLYQTNLSETTYPYAPLDGCKMEEDGTLRLSVLPPVGNKLRIIGIGPLTDDLTDDTDIIEVDRERLEILYWAAEHYLWEYLAKTAPSSDSERYRIEADRALGLWKIAWQTKAMQPPEFRVQVSHLSSWG